MECEVNRFACIGSEMTGDLYYIHRPELERILLERTVKYAKGGSINVVGLHRMGKSSLVHNTLVTKAEDFYKQNIIIARISADSKGNVNIFFKDMAKAVYKIMKKYGDIDDDLNDSYEAVKKLNVIEDGTSELESFFEIIKESGKRVVLIIDEFDNVSKLFENYESGFGVLRTLASQEETRVAFVYVSRRTAEQIESKIQGVSEFHNNLEVMYVKSFSDEELKEYFKINECSGVKLSDEEKKKLIEITGGQPYWSDILLAEYKKAKDKGITTDLEKIFQENRRRIYEEYGNMIRVLNEGKNPLGNKLYQLVFGPAEPDCTDLDADALYDYGIIVNKKNMQLISDKFKEYMELKEKEFNFYPIWHKTETGLREILKNKLEKQYRKEWENIILDQYCLKPKYIMEKLNIYFFKNQKPEPYIDKDNQKKYYIKNYFLSDNLYKASDQKRKMLRENEFKEDAVITLLEAIFTRGLFLLCEFEYKELNFEKIFGNKDKFVEKALHLSEARNSYSHATDMLLKDGFKRKTKEYCEALCESIDKFLKKN
ncbi:AAA-like domain-containing protein [bacterium]|nr:AAA-like domain-containing protein [bacterium]